MTELLYDKSGRLSDGKTVNAATLNIAHQDYRVKIALNNLK